MNTWKVILATVVIFAAGVLTGGVLSWRLERSSLAPAPHAGRPVPPSSPGGLRFDLLRRAQRELDLSAGQRERIDKMLKESQERTRKLMEPIAPELRQEVQRAKEEFRSLLTPEQQGRFDELLKKQAHQREGRRPQAPPDQRSTPGSSSTNR